MIQLGYEFLPINIYMQELKFKMDKIKHICKSKLIWLKYLLSFNLFDIKLNA